MRAVFLLLLATAALSDNPETERGRATRIAIGLISVNDDETLPSPKAEAIRRDPHKQRPRLVRKEETGEIWVKRLTGNALAVALLNPGDRPVSLDVLFEQLGLKGSPRVFHVWKNEDWGRVQGGFAQRVDPGGGWLFVIVPR